MKGVPDIIENERRAPPALPHRRIERHARQSIVPRMSPTLPIRVPYQPQGLEMDDDNMTDITKTEDDPVDQAFREVLGAADEGEEDEDEIVWNPGFVLRISVASLC